MKRPWSISTTVRNPDRIIPLLHTLKRIEGELFDYDRQVKFQIHLIQDKKFRPNDLTDDERRKFDTAEEITFAEAKSIFEKQNYVDPPMRGRTSFAPLKKLCLCTGSVDEPVMITNLGRDMLHSTNDIRDTFFNYFLKWQLPNPVDKKWAEVRIKPFLATLDLIRQVNAKWKAIGKRAVGISSDEFALFVPTLLSHENIKTHAEKILEYRKCRSDKARNNYARNFVRSFYELAADDSRITTRLNNLRDYGDNTVRYFRRTGYIQMRGNGHYIDLEPRRKIEIDSILNSEIPVAVDFATEEEYINYVNDHTKPELPWNNFEALQQINSRLTSEIPKFTSKLNKMGIDTPAPPPQSDPDLKINNDKLRHYLIQLQDHITRHEMEDIKKIEGCIDRLENIYQTKTRFSIELEKQATLGLIALNDAQVIHPNYPIGDDGEPTYTAPGKVADIECRYATFNMICEVTMLTGRNQWYSEGQPVMRHLRDFEINNKDNESYCMFVAPSIHTDTCETFWNAINIAYKGKPQKILPITIKSLCRILRILVKYKLKHKRVIPHQDMRDFYEKALSLVGTSTDSDDWVKNKIPAAIESWEGEVL